MGATIGPLLREVETVFTHIDIYLAHIYYMPIYAVHTLGYKRYKDLCIAVTALNEFQLASSLETQWKLFLTGIKTQT